MPTNFSKLKMLLRLFIFTRFKKCKLKRMDIMNNG